MKLICLLLVPAIVSCARGPGPVVPESRMERQMLGLLEKFDRWDLNGDGYLNVTELEPSRKITGNSPTRILDFYDTNKDGQISLREAQDGYARADEAELRAKR
ncbi:MAG: hypothetical protein WEB53_05765 [Akkermansiaceae bacterium]